jgi:hypothetical protein
MEVMIGVPVIITGSTNRLAFILLLLLRTMPDPGCLLTLVAWIACVCTHLHNVTGKGPVDERTELPG